MNSEKDFEDALVRTIVELRMLFGDNFVIAGSSALYLYGLKLDRLPRDVDFWWKGKKEDFVQFLNEKGMDHWFCDLPTDAAGLWDKFRDEWRSAIVVFRGLQIEVLALDQIFLSYRWGALYNLDPNRRQKCRETIEQINIKI